MRITSLQLCRKNPWLCLFLCCALVYAEYTHTASVLPSKLNQSLPLATLKLFKAYQKRENHKTSSVTSLLNSETKQFYDKSQNLNLTTILDEIDSKSRIGFEKNIMLVLPVKANATNANDTDLQMWYTQKPITEIIADPDISKPKLGMDYGVHEDVELVEDRHPYTNFLVNKMPSTAQKSSLHYGFPEIYKFREDLNGSMSNHKSNWTSANVTELTSPFSLSTTTQQTTPSINSIKNNLMPELEKIMTKVKKTEMISMQSPSVTIASTTPSTIATLTIPTTTTATSISLSDIAVYNVTEDVDDVPFIPESLNTILLQNFSDFPFKMNHLKPPVDANFFKLGTQSTTAEPFMKMSQNISGNILNNDLTNMLVELGIIKSDQISISTTEKVIIRNELVTPIYNSNSYNGFKKIPINAMPHGKIGISDDMNDLLTSFGLIPTKKSDNETLGNRISRQQNLTTANLNDLKINATSPFNPTYSKTNLSSSSGLNSSQINDDFEANITKFLEDDELIANSDKPLTLNSEMFPDNMKNTQEILGFLKQSSLHNRSVKSAHVFQPTSQLEKLNEDDATKKITDVLRTIKSLSVKTEANNITAEELEKQLQIITDSLESDSSNEVNDTLLMNILSNDTNLQLIESIDNITSKFYSANKTMPIVALTDVVVTETSATIIKIQPEIKTSSTTTEDIIQNIQMTTLNTTKLQPEIKPPNPLSTNELLPLSEISKNEMKRQQQQNVTLFSGTSNIESTTITSSIDDTSIPGASTEIFNINTEQPNTEKSFTTNSTTISSSTSSEEIGDSKASANNNAPIPALADSFGGGGVASEEPTTNVLPTPKPNGLYFYLDWNTFLNVGGEDDKRPIRIRFAPRAGNARNFLWITVP